MKKRKLKPFVIPMIYVVIVFLFGAGIYFMEESINDILFKSDINDGETKYVDDGIVNNNDYVPVVQEMSKFIKPFIDSDIVIVKNFYNYKDESDVQENSIIYYENIYMQNIGIDYSNGKEFDVLSSIDGNVIEVRNDNVSGGCVTISNANNVKVVYESLSNVTVKEGDVVSIGQSIGKSGNSSVNSDLGSHLHFELYINDVAVNPEDYYDKSVNDMFEG